ncbi:DUF402 domain-containing protein [Luedemannella flava]
MGRLILRRHFMRDDLLARVWVGRVAADDETGLWTWIATGSAYRDLGAADGRAFREVPFGEWGRTATAMKELTWRNDVLMLHPRAGAYSLWFFFDPDGGFRQWYVNLEEPGARWDDGGIAGIDTVDQDLDIVATADRAWRWKDEDEFADHLAHPDVYWVDDPEAVWAEGKRVVGLIESGAAPFDGRGCDFRPPAAWTPPVDMPAGWQRPRQAS